MEPVTDLSVSATGELPRPLVGRAEAAVFFADRKVGDQPHSQWNTTFGTPQAPSQASSSTTPASSTLGLVTASSAAADIQTIDDFHAAQAELTSRLQATVAAQTTYAPAPVPTFVTPAMWQESVASVYEGGLKRDWDYDVSAMSMAKRR